MATDATTETTGCASTASTRWIRRLAASAASRLWTAERPGATAQAAATPRPAKRNPRPMARWPGRAEHAGRLGREQRRQHGQRADDGGGDDEDRRQRDAREHAVAGQEHAAHRDHDRETETSTARPEVAAAISIASTCPTPRGPLLALAGDVEDRVVDTDGEADQQDDGLRGVGHREELARDGGQPERGHDGAHRERTGMPAIRRPPNAITRIRSVIGSESCSAFWKSLPCVSL